jgi:hypothetical protein
MTSAAPYFSETLGGFVYKQNLSFMFHINIIFEKIGIYKLISILLILCYGIPNYILVRNISKAVGTRGTRQFMPDFASQRGRLLWLIFFLIEKFAIIYLCYPRKSIVNTYLTKISPLKLHGRILSFCTSDSRGNVSY